MTAAAILRATAAELRARADALDATADAISGDGADPWLDAAALHTDYGIRMRRVVDAARRGEIVLGRAGRSPRVRRSAIDQWLARRPEPVATTTLQDDVDAALARAATG